MTSQIPGLLDREDVARLLTDLTGCRPVTPADVSTYLYRDGLPKPAIRQGKTPLWTTSQVPDIEEWVKSRPGRGAGGGRPKRQTA